MMEFESVMRFKHRVLIASFVAVTGITGTGIYFLSQSAAETERRRQIGQAESDCAGKVPAAIRLVTTRDSMQGARVQVTGSAYHYNRRLKQCLVEISTFEHLQTPVYVKTLVNAAGNSAMMSSMAGDRGGSVRNCFGAEAKPLDCTEADQRWKTLMSE